jgi:hypothetical protein
VVVTYSVGLAAASAAMRAERDEGETKPGQASMQQRPALQPSSTESTDVKVCKGYDLVTHLPCLNTPSTEYTMHVMECAICIGTV